MNFDPWKPFHYVAGRSLLLLSGDRIWMPFPPESPADLNGELSRGGSKSAQSKITAIISTRLIIRNLLLVNI